MTNHAEIIINEANLREINLEEANLLGTHLLTIDQLSKVKTLYDAKLDKELRILIFQFNCVKIRMIMEVVLWRSSIL